MVWARSTRGVHPFCSHFIMEELDPGPHVIVTEASFTLEEKANRF